MEQLQQKQQSISHEKSRSLDSSIEEKPLPKATRKKKLKHLTLTKGQLMEKVHALKNYSNWKQSKMLRINLASCSNVQQNPAKLDTLIKYGIYDGKNQVLAEIVEEGYRAEKKRVDRNYQEENRFQQMLKKQKYNRLYEISQRHKDDPTFVNYKQNQEERLKIYKILEEHPKKGQKYRKLRRETYISKSSSKKALNPQNKQTQRNIQFPRELSDLKKQLMTLPVVKTKSKTEMSDVSSSYLQSLHNNNNDSYLSLLKSSNVMANDNDFLTNLKNSSDNLLFVQKSIHNSRRNSYIQSIKIILNKSSECLKITEDKKITSLKSISCQNNLSSFSQEKNQNVPSLYKIKSEKKYWPEYQKYTVKSNDIQKIKKISDKFNKFIEDYHECNIENNELINLIDQKMNQRLLSLEQEVLKEEKNSFVERFSQKMALQAESYKKNLHELNECKRKYKIEKAREYIRANGIKRQKQYRKKQPINEFIIKQDIERILSKHRKNHGKYV